MTLLAIFALEQVGSRQFRVGSSANARLGGIYKVVDNIGDVLILELV